MVKLPKDLVHPGIKDFKQIIKKVFHHIESSTTLSTALLSHNNSAILCAKNDTAAEINEVALNMMRGDIISKLSADSVDSDNIPIEYVNSITPNSCPPHELRLKIGCPLILLRNINIKKGTFHLYKIYTYISIVDNFIAFQRFAKWNKVNIN